MKVAFQGERGAYSESAVIALFGDEAEPIPCITFDEAFSLVNNNDVERGVIPIENSLAGSIYQNYDLPLQYPLTIVGEHYLRVRHCVIANPGVSLSDIRRITSQLPALDQCRHYIKRLGLKIEPTNDTAGSVRLLKESKATDMAAIASRRAAEVNGLTILAEGIEDNEANFTRFLIISHTSTSLQHSVKSWKTSIVFNLRNAPGSLFKVLGLFALANIDLTKIESRPIPGKVGEYTFYLDFLGHIDESTVAKALTDLAEISTSLRVLGCYPQFIFE